MKVVAKVEIDFDSHYLGHYNERIKGWCCNAHVHTMPAHIDDEDSRWIQQYDWQAIIAHLIFKGLENGVNDFSVTYEMNE